jgi:hypothetical protein
MRQVGGTRATLVRLVGAILACLALAAPASVLAQEGGSAPSAGELWRQYPLGPKRPSPPKTTPAAAPLRSPESTARSSSGGGSNDAVLAGLTILTLAILTLAATGGWATLYALRRRRERAPAEAIPAPVAPVPSTRRAPSALTLVADPAEEETRMTRMTEPEPTPRPTTLAPPEPDLPWTAEIEWEQADGRCRFCVAAAAHEGDETPIARSGWLGWPPDEHTPITALGDAVGALEAQLTTAGWTALEPGSAWYAKRFAWTPVAEPALPVIALPESPPAMEIEQYASPRRFVRATEWPQGSEDGWRCEIRWSAGYVSSRFEAVALPPGERKGRPVGESAAFKWLLMSDPDPSTREHDAAVTSLEDALLDAGWERGGRGLKWYAERFVWPGSGEPPSRVEPAVAEAAPPA